MGLFSNLFKRKDTSRSLSTITPNIKPERQKTSGKWKSEPRYDKDGKMIAGVHHQNVPELREGLKMYDPVTLMAREQFIAVWVRWLKGQYLDGDERYMRTFDFTDDEETQLIKEANNRYQESVK